jgi:hypothetical protein
LYFKGDKLDYSFTLKIPCSKEKVFSFFCDIEKFFRLNPQWELLSLEGEVVLKKGSNFLVHTRHDRSETEFKYNATVDDLVKGEFFTISLEAETHSMLFTISVKDGGDFSIIEYNETMEEEISAARKREINLWIKSIANYILTQEKKTPFSRAWKWFLDKIWLKMSPSGKRIVLIVVISEILALVFFILLLVYLLIFKRF